jgi:hypothetical protein
MDLSPNHASMDGINRLTVDSISWLGENMLKPLYNSGVVEPERAVASTAKGLTGLELPRLEFQNVSKAEPWSAAWCTQAVANAAGMTLPYLLSGKMASRALATGGRLAVTESMAGTLLSREATAQIVGATAYDAMRMPTGNQSRFTNAAAGAVSFGTFELGNSIAARTNPVIGTAVRLAAGFVGGSSHQIISEGSSNNYQGDGTSAKFLQAGLSGAALNSLLPLAGRAFARASDELTFAQRPDLSHMLANLPPETGMGANRWVGWMSENNPRFRLTGEKAQGHPIPELPMRGNHETANLGIADFNTAQRRGIYLSLERQAHPQLAQPERIASLVDNIYDGTKHWKGNSGSTNSSGSLAEGAITDGTTAASQAQSETIRFQGQASDIANSVNKFADENGLTKISVVVLDQPGFLAAYGPGTGRLKVGSAGFANESLTPAMVEKVAHEYTHALQDNQILRMLADKHGVGITATKEQIKAISTEYNASTNSALDQRFLSQIMKDRNGIRLSMSETLNAKQLLASMKLYAKEQPLAARGGIDLTLTQIEQSVDILAQPEGGAILKEAIADGAGPMVDMMKGTVPYANQLGTAPEKLRGLGRILEGDSSAMDANAFRTSLMDIAHGLQGMRQVAQSRYLRFSFEQQAMSTGTLAKIHAVSKAAQIFKGSN